MSNCVTGPTERGSMALESQPDREASRMHKDWLRPRCAGSTHSILKVVRDLPGSAPMLMDQQSSLQDQTSTLSLVHFRTEILSWTVSFVVSREAGTVR